MSHCCADLGPTMSSWIDWTVALKWLLSALGMGARCCGCARLAKAEMLVEVEVTVDSQWKLEWEVKPQRTWIETTLNTWPWYNKKLRDKATTSQRLTRYSLRRYSSIGLRNAQTASIRPLFDAVIAFWDSSVSSSLSRYTNSPAQSVIKTSKYQYHISPLSKHGTHR